MQTIREKPLAPNIVPKYVFDNINTLHPRIRGEVHTIFKELYDEKIYITISWAKRLNFQ